MAVCGGTSTPDLPLNLLSHAYLINLRSSPVRTHLIGSPGYGPPAVCSLSVCLSARAPRHSECGTSLCDEDQDEAENVCLAKMRVPPVPVSLGLF